MPRYVSDLDVYVWRRYCKPPISQFAYVVRLPIKQLQQQRLIVLLNSTTQLDKFNMERSSSLLLNDFITSSTNWTSISEVILTIFAVYRLMIADTSAFLTGVHEQLDYLVTILFFWNKCCSITLYSLANFIMHSSMKADAVHRQPKSNICFILKTVAKMELKVFSMH